MKYNDIINDCAIMGCKPIIDTITKTIYKISINPFSKIDWFEKCIELCETKRKYLLEYKLFFEIFNKMQDKERYLIYNYLYRNHTYYQICRVLKISQRTFFRLLNKVCNKYRKYRGIIYANNKISYPLKRETPSD